MAWADQHPFQPEIQADLARMTPLHDFVLVRPMPSASAIIDPGVHMTQDYRWRENRPRGNRLGRVVAIGRGDRMLALFCRKCEEKNSTRIGVNSWTCTVSDFMMRLETATTWRCRACGGDTDHIADADGRYPMGVALGDVVVFPRVPANEIEINGVEYCFLHEEQHVLAVVEEEKAA